MAYPNNTAHCVSKSRPGGLLAFALSAALSCIVIAGAGWGLASTVGAMREAASTLSRTNLTLGMPRRVEPVAAQIRQIPRAVRAVKSARLSKPSDTEIRRAQLTVAAIRVAHERRVAAQAQVALAEESKRAAKAKIVAALARAKSAVQQVETLSVKPSLVTALVEDIPVRDIQPFGLVLAEPKNEEDVALPSQVPLPEARPLIERVDTDQKPAEEKPAVRSRRDKTDDAKDVAYAKPERSLLGDLFKSKTNHTGWLGKGTKVAIYDVSNATVYLPDGTKLRAHSGIGHMRDNPRYEHVTMRGPTPAGIYRLKMREKRFYGVEAIRMTSIDGRDPKNRTGLLTHTNLLRGQKGSHGCVAFQNYEPFLRAFKRGQITMLVVVPKLPSSRTQLAALYRKAGA
jgi:hypothetical protein